MDYGYANILVCTKLSIGKLPSKLRNLNLLGWRPMNSAVNINFDIAYGSKILNGKELSLLQGLQV